MSSAWSNPAPGFNGQPNDINGFSNPILEVFRPQLGAHVRNAIGLAGRPLDVPVEIEGGVEIHAQAIRPRTPECGETPCLTKR